MNIQTQIEGALRAIGFKPSAELTTQLEAANTALSAAQAQVSTLNDEKATLVQERDTALATITRLETEAATAAEASAQAIADKEASVETRAGAKTQAGLRVLGVDPVADDVKVDPKAATAPDAATLWKQYNALGHDHSAQRAFWVQHKAILSAD